MDGLAEGLSAEVGAGVPASGEEPLRRREDTQASGGTAPYGYRPGIGEPRHRDRRGGDRERGYKEYFKPRRSPAPGHQASWAQGSGEDDRIIEIDPGPHQHRGPPHRPLLQQIDKHIKPGMRVLDIGCAPGFCPSARPAGAERWTPWRSTPRCGGRRDEAQSFIRYNPVRKRLAEEGHGNLRYGGRNIIADDRPPDPRYPGC